MTDPTPPPDRRPLCRPQFECEVCKRGAQDLEPGNYLTRTAPLGTTPAHWRCRDHVSIKLSSDTSPPPPSTT